MTSSHKIVVHPQREARASAAWGVWALTRATDCKAARCTRQPRWPFLPVLVSE